MEKPKEKKSTFEKVRNAGIKKISRAVVIIFFVFAMTFATITNVGFKSFDVGKWAANMLIMIGILVFGLVMGESGGIDYYRGLENGVYKKNVKEYNEFNEKIKPFINNFENWFTDMIPSELENKKVNFLVKNGIKIITSKRIVKYCKLDDLENLKKDITKKTDENNKEIYIEKLEEYQMDAVKWVLEGKIILDTPNAYYFTTLYNDELNDITIFEQSKSIVRKRKKVKNMNRATRITTSVVFSALWASLTVYQMMSGESLESWMNLISRIAGLFTAILSGYLGAKVMVNLDSRQIKNKYEVLVRYYNDVVNNKYQVKDEQELLKNKYEKEQERKKKEEEEAKNNVITPELINPEIENTNIKELENKSNQIE